MPRRLLLVLLVVVAVVPAVVLYFRSPGAFELALDALERGDWQEAERRGALLEKRGRVLDAHYVRGHAAVIAGRAELERSARSISPEGRSAGRQARQHFTRALGLFEQVPKDHPYHLEAGALAGESFARLGNHKQAVDAFLYVVKRQPDHARAHRWLADLYLELGAANRALPHLVKLEEIEPDDGLASVQAGGIYEGESRTGEAIACYRRALSRRLEGGSAADVVRSLGILLVTQGLYEEALGLLDRFPPTPGRKVDYLCLAAECHWGLGRREEGTKLVEQALQMSPQCIPALWLRARMALDSDRPGEAIPHLRCILSLEPHNTESREQLAGALARTGDVEGAERERARRDQSKVMHERIAQLNREAARHPWDAEIRYQMALALIDMNRLPEARKWLQAALTCDPAHKGAARALERLPTDSAAVAPLRVPVIDR